MNRRQWAVLVAGIMVGSVALLFPPWRCGRFSLPYRPHWPPPSAPNFSMTFAPPLSVSIDAPEWKPALVQAVTTELQTELAREQGRPGVQDGNDALLRSMRRVIQVDVLRLAAALVVIGGATAAGIWLLRDRRPPRQEAPAPSSGQG
jgi:hypothetical protein